MNDFTPGQMVAEDQILRVDPRKYIQIMSERIRNDPNDSSAYFSRHQGWERLCEWENALADLDQSIKLRPSVVGYERRGNIFAQLGRHDEALQNFSQAEAMDPSEWLGSWGPLYQANSFACLGKEPEALAACDRLAEDHWSPGFFGTPAGSKREVIDEIHRRIAAARM